MPNCFYYFKFCKLSGALDIVSGTDFDRHNLQLLYTWHFSHYTQPIRCTYVLLSKIINSTFRSEHLVRSSARVLTCQNLLHTWNIGNMLPNNLSNIYISVSIAIMIGNWLTYIQIPNDIVTETVFDFGH